MHRGVRFVVPLLMAAGLSCRSATPAPAPAPVPAGAGNQAVAQRGGDEGPPGGRGELPPGERFRFRRVPLTPEQRAARRDSATADRQRLVDEVMKTIAGRENEPAGKVFKNVKLLKDMPAGKFLELMNNDYGKALGRNCNFCHVPDHWDSDKRKEKQTARMMIQMTDSINDAYLVKLKNPRGMWPHIDCVTCHRGFNEPNKALLAP